MIPEKFKHAKLSEKYSRKIQANRTQRNQITRITSKPEYIRRKSPFNKITKCEGVIDHKIIRKIHRNIQANAPTVHSELGGEQHGLLGLAMQPATYRTVTAHDFQHPALPPQAAPVPANADAAEVPRYIQHHAAQVDQWRQMVNAEVILKQQLIEPLDENYSEGQCQAYINYANRTLMGLIQHLYDDHGNISPMYTKESEKKMKQELLLLYLMVDLFKKLKKEWYSQKILTPQSQEGN